MSQPATRQYTVRGMSCEHCRDSVVEEISEIDGVEGAEVDLASGQLTVTASHVSDEQIKAAVQDAGYEVVGASA